MKRKTAVYLANWLKGLPVIVQIGHRTYPAAQYTIESEHGIRKTRLYILGELPPLHSKMKRICYRTDDTGYDWHLLACFRQRTACTEWQEVHPFGTHFILAEFSPVENWATDQCEKKPLRRIPMKLTVLGPGEPGVNQPTEEKQNGDDHGNGHVSGP